MSYCRITLTCHPEKSDKNNIVQARKKYVIRQTVRQRGGQTGRLSRGSVLKDVIVWFVRMWCDGHSTRRFYQGGLWGELSCFGSLDLFARETRHPRSVAFVLQHAKHTEWMSFNSLTPPAEKVEFMPLHLSGVVSFYSSSGYGFKVCILAVTALILLLVR